MLNLRANGPTMKRGGRGVLGASLRGIGFSTDDVCVKWSGGVISMEFIIKWKSMAV